jgi:hypothetical protein
MENMTSNTGGSVATVNEATAPPPPAAPPAAVPAPGKARVAVSEFQRVSDALLIVLVGRIISAMTGNAAYAKPDPTLAALAAARTSFIAAVEAARGNLIGMAVKRQQRAALVALLRKLAHYVQVTSAGDLPTLMGSGFTAQRTRQPIGRLAAPGNLRLLRGKATGQLIARCEKLDQAGAYEWRYAVASAPTVWTNVGATLAASTTLEDLVPGTQYIVQARAVGSTGPSDWSDAATLMVV